MRAKCALQRTMCLPPWKSFLWCIIPGPCNPWILINPRLNMLSTGDNTLGRVGLCSWTRSLRRNCVTSLSCNDEGWWTWKFCFHKGPWSGFTEHVRHWCELRWWVILKMLRCSSSLWVGPAFLGTTKEIYLRENASNLLVRLGHGQCRTAFLGVWIDESPEVRGNSQSKRVQA